MPRPIHRLPEAALPRRDCRTHASGEVCEMGAGTRLVQALTPSREAFGVGRRMHQRLSDNGFFCKKSYRLIRIYAKRPRFP